MRGCAKRVVVGLAGGCSALVDATTEIVCKGDKQARGTTEQRLVRSRGTCYHRLGK